MTINKTINQIIGIGAVAGMRTTFAPALVSHYLSIRPHKSLKNSKLGFIISPAATYITKALCVMEITGDKLPTTPNRIAFPQILGRIASGAFAGAVLAKANHINIVKGTIVGGASALAATFASFYLRQLVDKIPQVKDVYTGAAEDALAVGFGILIMK